MSFFNERKGENMKTKIRNLLLGITLLFTSIFGSGNVMASANDSNISYQRINDTYFYLQNNVTGAVDTNHTTKFFLNDRIAYCIEPMVDINTRVYNSTNDWSVTGLSGDDIHYIELVGYYGYEYAGHQNDRFWLAAQTLIWERVNPNVSVRFTTGANGTGSTIDLSNEKNEILSLVNRYDIKPNFNNSDIIETNIGSEITLTDVNGVLDEYSMEYNGVHNVSKNGNTLSISAKNNEITNETIKFKRNSYDANSSIIYYQGESQKLASLRVSAISEKTFTLKVDGGTVKLDKKGEKTTYENASYKYDEINLPNVTYAVYANENIENSRGDILFKKYDLVGTLTTDENGIATLPNLNYGKYFAIEGESSLDNMINDEKYYFNITKDDIIDGKIVKELNFKNFLPKGKLQFSKTDLTTGNGIPNTVIQIFTEEDKLIFTGTTDEKGNIVIDNLPANNKKYYIIEKSASTGYKLSDEKVYFELTENGQVIKAHMTNEKIKGNLVFLKTDEDGNALAGIKISIYRKDGTLYGTYTTDENGLVEIKDIEYGEYKVKEISTLDGYELEGDVLYFSILEDGDNVKLSMINKKLPQTSKNDYKKNIAIFLISLGGILIIVKIRKKDK